MGLRQKSAFHVQQPRASKRVQGLAIIGLVCPEARVKFKNIDFRTEADFACYCIISVTAPERTHETKDYETVQLTQRLDWLEGWKC